MKKLLLAVIFLYFQFLQSQVAKQPKIYDSKIAIFEYDETKNNLFENAKNAELTESEIKLADKILMKAVSNYNRNRKSRKIRLEDYKRQYVVAVNNKNEKLIWINCAHEKTTSGWKSYIIDVDDGGNYFFNLKINLAERTYFDFVTNGPDL